MKSFDLIVMSQCPLLQHDSPTQPDSSADKYWDAIECIVLLGRDQITYKRNDVLALLVGEI